jgi:hypothetical protein
MSVLFGLLVLATSPAQAAGLHVSAASQAHRALHALQPRWVSSNVFDATFTGSCKFWTERADSHGYDEEWTPSNGNTNCAQAVADWSSTPSLTAYSCDYFVWVPSFDANALLKPVVYDTSGHANNGVVINENYYTDQWAYFGQFSNGDRIVITDANGQTGTYIGLGGNYHDGTQTDTFEVDCGSNFGISENVFDASFTGSCKSWTEQADSQGYDEEWTPSNGSTNCAQAVASWNGNNISIAGCDYFVWVPSFDANAQFTPTVTDIYGNVYQGAAVNENDYTDQWAFFGQFNNGTKISITDANGQSGTYIGLGGNYHHGTQTDTYRVDC